MGIETYSPDNLVAGTFPLKTSQVTLLAGSGTLVRGSVLGKITKGAVSIAADEGNTGDGAAGEIVRGMNAIVGAYLLECILATYAVGEGAIAAVQGNTGNGAPGELTVGDLAQIGVYTLECIEAVENKGTFAVYAPDGSRLQDLIATTAYDNGHFAVTIAEGDQDFIVGDSFTVTIAAGAGTQVFSVLDPNGVRLKDLTIGAAYDNGHFAVTIADGDTDFAVGDMFTVTVAAGAGQYRLADSTSTDGSAEARVILAETTTVALLADSTHVPVYETGEFNAAALTFGGEDTAAVHSESLRARGIGLKTVSAQ